MRQQRGRYGRAHIVALGAMLGVGAVAVGDEFRTIDGTGNNIEHPAWGATFTPLVRLTLADYADGIAAPAGADRPSARAISNAVCAQNGPMPHPDLASNFLWQWGQFIDHDMDLSDAAFPVEPFHIEVPMGDDVFDPEGTGTAIIPLLRSIFDPESGTDTRNPREQVNEITAFLDASQVYGVDEERALALRTLDGTGRLKTSEGNLLPFNVDGLPNLGGPDPGLFLAGDIRCNEQVALTSLHTLFVREHNRFVDELFAEHGPDITGDKLYEMARLRVGALIQIITYQEFLPMLLGPGALEPYEGYDKDVHPGIATEFSAATFRVGHTLLSPLLLRIDEEGNEIPGGHLELRDAFFAPEEITGYGIEPILRGLAAGAAQTVDARIIDDVRNFLFLAPDPSGLDLAALNMQRGRDHGLPSYNAMRMLLGLDPADDFADITSDPAIQAGLAAVYDSVDDVDPWLGAVAEDHELGASVGELIFTVLKDQFERLRDGDRFWYELMFDGSELDVLERTTLADVIRRNTDIGDELAADVFHVGPCLADLDANGIVNGVDLAMLLAAWGDEPGAAALDGDGRVNGAALAILLGAWGTCA